MSNQMPPPQGGDLPVHARERLSIMRGDATHRGLFTSDLSVNEFLLVREAGFDPVGLVVGSSIYHIGFQFSNFPPPTPTSIPSSSERTRQTRRQTAG